jgi:hypothetical protein
MGKVKRRAAAQPQQDKTPTVPPNDPLYALIVKGSCLASVPDGTTIAVARDERPEAGDYVVLWFRSGRMPIVKRLTLKVPHMVKAFPYTFPPGSEAMPAIVFEQQNPPLCYSIEATRLAALHKVIGKFSETRPIGGWQNERDIVAIDAA